jgi:hypothetical protein
MAELVLHGGDVADLAAAVAELLVGAFAVLDIDGRCLASVGDVGPSALLQEAAAAARALGLNAAQFRTRLYRARRALRRALDAELALPPSTPTQRSIHDAA